MSLKIDFFSTPPPSLRLVGRAPRLWQDTPEYKEWLTWMKKYNSSGNVADAANVYGYDAAQTMIAVLKACGDNLTRESVVKHGI